MSEDNDYLVMVQDQAKRFLDDNILPDHLKNLLEQPGSFDSATWASAVTLGWPATPHAEETGGLGMGWRGLCVLTEELGRVTASIPLIPTATVARFLLDAGDTVADPQYAAQLVSGERSACLGTAQFGHGGVAFAPGLQLRDGKLYGEMGITPFAASCDYALLPAESEGALCLVLAWLDQPGVTREIRPTIDNSRSAASLRFDAAGFLAVAAGADVQDKFWTLMGSAAIATAFEQIGGAQASLDMALGHALQRKAFGQLIGRFQQIKAKLVDMFIRIQLARGCALDALAAMERGDDTWIGLAASARVAAIDAYEFAARENIQTHGALGVTWEAMPHHHYRRSRALAVELGAAIVWRECLLGQIGPGFAD